MTERHAEALKQLKAERARRKKAILENAAYFATVGFGSLLVITGVVMVLNLTSPIVDRDEQRFRSPYRAPAATQQYVAPTVKYYDWRAIESIVIAGDQYEINAIKSRISIKSNVKNLEILESVFAGWKGTGIAQITLYLDGGKRRIEGLSTVDDIEGYLRELER